MLTFLLTAGGSIALTIVTVYVLVGRSSGAQRNVGGWLNRQAVWNRQMSGASMGAHPRALPTGEFAPLGARRGLDGVGRTNQPNTRIRPGDLVEVEAPDAILRTLDAEGASDHLPFMPEMLEYCGKTFRVSRRAVLTCCAKEGSPRGFRTDDVVTLDGLRCTGAAHDGCQRGCLIFWREAWLRKVDEAPAIAPSTVAFGADAQLRARLKTKVGPTTYFCQATELANATNYLSRWQRVAKCFSGLRAGNFNARQISQSIGIWLVWKLRRIALHISPHRNHKPAALEAVNLQPGDWAKIKPIESIKETLNEKGQNQGLLFMPGMHLSCGEVHQVQGRIGKMIVDDTGQMRNLRNTVCLQGSVCACAYMGFGMSGCSRSELAFWREGWLQTMAAADVPVATKHITIIDGLHKFAVEWSGRISQIAADVTAWIW